MLTLVGCAEGSTLPPVPDGGYTPLPDTGVTATCRGNRDGVISRDEVVFVPGVTVRYRVNPTGTQAPVNPVGVMRADGSRLWDFSDTAGELHPLVLQRSEGQWFAPRFTTAQYAAALDPRAASLGVYRATDTAVELLGVVGANEAEGTLVQYDTPVSLLRFPMMEGGRWSIDALAMGMVAGTPVASRDHYDVTVDAHGEVRLAEFTFPNVVRVKIETTQRFSAGGIRKIQYLWMTECYGEVTRMTSLDNEVNPDFTRAQEYRRLGL